MATVGSNLKRLREAAGYATPTEFARAAGMSLSQVSDLESDRYGLPDTRTLLKVAKVLKQTIDALLVDVDPDYSVIVRADAVQRSLQHHDVDEDRIDVSGHTLHDLPIIVEGEASPQGHLFWDNEGKLQSDVDDRITRPHDVGDPRAYGLRIRGDSMVPIYRPKMVVVVSPSTPVADGDEVYVELVSGERLVKTARRATGGWLLESANQAYPARFVKVAEVGTIHPIVWSKRKDSGRRMVDDVKRNVEQRVADRKRAGRKK